MNRYIEKLENQNEQLQKTLGSTQEEYDFLVEKYVDLKHMKNVYIIDIVCEKPNSGYSMAPQLIIRIPDRHLTIKEIQNIREHIYMRVEMSLLYALRKYGCYKGKDKEIKEFPSKYLRNKIKSKIYIITSHIKNNIGRLRQYLSNFIYKGIDVSICVSKISSFYIDFDCD